MRPLPPPRYLVYITQREAVLDNQTSYSVNTPWRWGNTTPTTWPLPPVSQASFGSQLQAKDFSVKTIAGKTVEVATNDVQSTSSKQVPAQVTASTTRQFSKSNTNPTAYTVFLDHTIEISVPSIQFDARHDQGELIVNLVVAARGGGAWDPIVDLNGGFVVEVDVANLLDETVTRVANLYLAQPAMTAYTRIVGLVKDHYSTIKIGVHWSWTWKTEWSQQIEYDISFTSVFRALSRTVGFALQQTLTDDSSTATLVAAQE